MASSLLGYFITFTTYGTWLHGDARGSWNRTATTLREYFVPPDPLTVAEMRKRMKFPAITLSGPMRKGVREAITQCSADRGWTLSALAVRTNHVHVVVVAQNSTAQQVMVACKARATAALRRGGLASSDQPIWTERASKIPLTTPQSFAAAVDYVLHGQGPELPDD